MRAPRNERIELIGRGICYLKLARDVFKRADAPKTLKRVRLSLTSAGGALRNAECKRSRRNNDRISD